MAEYARQIAEAASFQAFINGYLREVDGGRLWPVRHWREVNPGIVPKLTGDYLIELELPSQQTKMLLDLSYRSIAGCHRTRAVYCQQHEGQWRREGFWSALLTLVKEIYSGNKVAVSGPVESRQLELTYRLTDSVQNMIAYLSNHSTAPDPLNSFSEAEQSLLYGHWLHPTPKSRQGMLEWQHRLFAPELHGEFRLHYFAVERSLVQWESDDEHPDPPTISLAAADWPLEILQENEVLLPAHPLQAQWLLARRDLQPWFVSGQIRSLGEIGNLFTATSSVRTVFQEQFPWMFKFSVPVKITNSLRQNKKHELLAGALMSRLYEAIGFSAQRPNFHLISDPSFITVNLPGFVESGFEVIIRRNPFCDDDGRGKITLAALLQDQWPLEGEHSPITQSPLQKIIQNLAAEEQRPELEVARDWFDKYWECAIEPLLMLLDKWGIGLEAHQQNSVVDVARGYPSAYFYRDNQGFYLSKSEQQKLLTRLPQLSRCPELFYEQDMMLNRFTYYLIVNHLFALIYRFGNDGYADESYWIGRTQSQLVEIQSRMQGLGHEFIERLLTRDTLPAKANLLTRVNDIDELEADLEMAVYVSIANPLRLNSKVRKKIVEVAYA